MGSSSTSNTSSSRRHPKNDGAGALSPILFIAARYLLVAALALLPSSNADASPFSTPVKKVTITGGTHGNEYTGIWCIKAIEKQRELYNAVTNSKHTNAADSGGGGGGGGETPINIFREYPSLSIDTLLANPRAYMANKRFIDTDLNREFGIDKLKETIETCSDETCSESTSSLPYEAMRAREIELMLGSKVDASSTDDPLMDIVIDLHTTTANMGITIITTEGDALMSAAAAYVLHKCKTVHGYENVYCLLLPRTTRRDRTHLPSCGRHDFTIEVGPTPQGVIRHDVVEQTEAAMHSLLEFLHLRNLELEEPSKDSAASVLGRLRDVYPDGVPCYQSAPAVGHKALHGKIQWPSVPDNPNFPAYMIHKSLQDCDFQPLRTGDPLFVALDGTIVTYDGSFGEEVLLMFVNEGGYYYASSGTGIGVAVKSQFDWEMDE